MKKIIKVLIVFMLAIPLLISPVSAWSISTHQTIASKVYYSLPSSVQHNLNLNEMKRGSIAPDTVFKDFTNHQNPAGTKQAQNWLNKAKSAYKAKNYNYASYCYGVASHYITDCFAAPHCVVGETTAQHGAYENQGTGIKPSIRYIPGSLNTIFRYGYRQGQIDWKLWVKTKNSRIVQMDQNNAASAAYSLIRNYI